MENNFATSFGNKRGIQEEVSYDSVDFPIALFKDEFDSFLGNSYDLHWHDEVELLLVIKGEVTYFLNRQVHTVSEGDGAFIGSRVMHAAQQKQAGSLVFNILFPIEILARMLHDVTFHKYTLRSTGWTDIIRILHKDDSQEQEILAGLADIFESENEPDALLVQTEAVLHIWRYLLRILKDVPADMAYRTNLREERMRLMVSYIQGNFAYPLSVADIASAANISRSECFRCFTLFGQTSPVDYLNRYRLEEARKRLISTQESISYISSSCGFSGNSYFSRTFRDRYGTSPASFRKKHSSETAPEEKPEARIKQGIKTPVAK